MWVFKPKGDKTQVTFDMEYEFGGGIAGKLLGRAAEPIVRGNLQRSVETLKCTRRSSARGPTVPTAAKAALEGHHKICNKGATRAREAPQNLQQSQLHAKIEAKKPSRNA